MWPSDLYQLAERMLAAYQSAGKQIVTAESCTGGLISSVLTAVPGSSAVYQGSVISYANAVKEKTLGIPSSLLQQHGAVSEPVAKLMAENVREKFDFLGSKNLISVAVTGIAGPDGGNPEKPVGLVYLATATTDTTTVQQRTFNGDREAIRLAATKEALKMLLAAL